MNWLLNFFWRLFRPTPQPPPVPPEPKPQPPSGLTTVLLALVNRERQTAGVSRWAHDSRLGRAAQDHSDQMALHRTLSHQLPGEVSPGSRLGGVGYAHAVCRENVAAGQDTALAVVQWWLESPGHRRNLLSADCVHVGFGLAIAGDGTHYWTMNAARPLAGDGPQVAGGGAYLVWLGMEHD